MIIEAEAIEVETVEVETVKVEAIEADGRWAIKPIRLDQSS